MTKARSRVDHEVVSLRHKLTEDEREERGRADPDRPTTRHGMKAAPMAKVTKAKEARAAAPSGMIVPPPSRRGRFPCGAAGCTVMMWTEAAMLTHRAMCPAYARGRTRRD